MSYHELTREELIARLEAAEVGRLALAARLAAAAEPERLLHELQVHQLELEAQNQALSEAQGELEESRGRYVDLYDFAPMAYCTFDRDGVVLEVNLTGATMLGKERAWITGKPFLALVRVEQPDDFIRHIRRSIAAAGTVTGECAFATERGTMEVQLVSAAERRPHGRPRSCHTALVDVTRRKAAEREAREAQRSEHALRGRIEGIDRASSALSAALARLSGPELGEFFRVIVDQARELTHAQYAALGIGGADGQPFDPWVSSGMDREQAAAIGRAPRGVGLIGAVMHGGRPIRVRDAREHASFIGLPPAHPPVTSFLGVPIRYQGQERGNLYLANKQGSDEFSDDDRSLVELLAERVGIAMEIAQLRQLEAREHARLEFLAKAGPLLAETLDYETRLHVVTRLVVPVVADVSCVELLQERDGRATLVGYHPDAEKERLLERLLGESPPDGRLEEVRDAIATARPQLMELGPEVVAREVPDPARRQLLEELGVVSAIAAPLVLGGRVFGVLCLGMAESGRRYSDADLPLAQEIAHHAALAIEGARLYRVAQAAIRARDDMLAVVSHDLRNYLSTIRLSAELLAHTRQSSSRADEAAVSGSLAPLGVLEGGRRQVEVIGRVATRMNLLINSLCDKAMIETGHFTIEPQLEDVAAMLGDAVRTLEPQAESRSLRLSAEVGPRLSSVRCDRERVVQVIANLVGNATKFTEPGGAIRVVASRVEDAVCISVTDTGAGIASGQLAHVFDHYWKGRPDRREGSGLGLYIAKGIVEAHGGTIWADSVVGTGSTFSFTLPDAPPSRAPHVRIDDPTQPIPCRAG
jgi:PAS domain S-box-containing protein